VKVLSDYYKYKYMFKSCYSFPLWKRNSLLALTPMHACMQIVTTVVCSHSADMTFVLPNSCLHVIYMFVILDRLGKH
jgi:hypothetical protein